MIRVLIAEDEPPVLRRTKRLIENIDKDFYVAAAAADGEEALDKMREEHFDVLFTDIRMPVMDGMRLMQQVQQQYPDCSIVVLSGYQDFEYVTTAVRAQAVDYLLKPVTEETLEKLLFKLKEKFAALKQERMQQSIASRINRLSPHEASITAQPVNLGICLFCAGSVPHSADLDLYSHTADVWEKISLVGMAKSVCPEGIQFVQEYIGDLPAERILVYQASEECDRDWKKQLYSNVCQQSELPINCVFLSDTVAVSDIGKIHKRLGKLLASRVIIGRNLFLSVSTNELIKMNLKEQDFAEDSDLAMHFADIMISGDTVKSKTFRHKVFERFERENWTQRRVLSFFLRVITLLELKEYNPGNVFQYREWFYHAVSLATSMKELEKVIESLEDSNVAINEGNETIIKVEAYLRSHYNEHITGQTLSKKFGYVPSYISFLFKQSYGQSPADYLTKLRLNKAKELMLSQPMMLVREVAEKVGFKNQYHFSRVFKKNEGLWPTDFKC